MQVNHLYTYWDSLFPQASESATQNTFAQLKGLLCQKHRHYHTMQHVKELLLQLTAFSLTESQHQLLVAVCFFHDSIYQPLSKKNEKRSARYAKKMLSQLQWQEEAIEDVCAIIHDTQQHLPSNKLSAIFQDMDLAILGTDSSTYTAYQKAIRKEFSLVPNIIYAKGRKHCLQQFLEKPFLYTQPKYRALFEKQARINLKQEIDSYDY